MARVQFTADTYNYYYWSSRTSTKANLTIKGGSGHTCSVWFVDDDETNLPQAYQVAPNYFAFYYHYHQLDSIVDMLRNESPVVVYFNNDNGFNNSRIATMDEPVGEGEGLIS